MRGYGEMVAFSGGGRDVGRRGYRKNEAQLGIYFRRAQKRQHAK